MDEEQGEQTRVFELSFGQKKNQNLSDPGIGDFQSHLIDDPKLTDSR
jgi:hypothetical protein